MKQNIAKKGDGYDKATSDFWDLLQGKGTKVFYEYGFANTYFEYIRPKYKVIPTSRIINMFDGCKYLKKVESAYFDLSGASSVSGNYAVFRTCPELLEVEDIKMQASNYYQTWRSCPKLETIAIMRVNTSCTFDGVFFGDYALKNITISGSIGKSGLSFADCPLLTVASLNSIFNALDTSTPTVTKTITFNPANATTMNSADPEYTNQWEGMVASKLSEGWSIGLI